jgi:hypothetical protein
MEHIRVFVQVRKVGRAPPSLTCPHLYSTVGLPRLPAVPPLHPLHRVHGHGPWSISWAPHLRRRYRFRLPARPCRSDQRPSRPLPATAVEHCADFDHRGCACGLPHPLLCLCILLLSPLPPQACPGRQPGPIQPPCRAPTGSNWHTSCTSRQGEPSSRSCFVRFRTFVIFKAAPRKFGIDHQADQSNLNYKNNLSENQT